ncbi:MAG: hypothetical protein AB7I08_12305 [Thermoleophilia bacterium]
MPDPTPTPTPQVDEFSDLDDVLPDFAAEARRRQAFIDQLRDGPDATMFVGTSDDALRRDLTVWRAAAAEIRQLIGTATAPHPLPDTQAGTHAHPTTVELSGLDVVDLIAADPTRAGFWITNHTNVDVWIGHADVAPGRGVLIRPEARLYIASSAQWQIVPALIPFGAVTITAVPA